MSMFTVAQKEVGFVKASLYGPPGTGKTTLLAMLLLYLSKTYHQSAPVAWLASEKGVDFVIDFFKAEGVPLLVSRSRSFVDLKNAHAEALKQGCCGLGIDSTTHFWAELLSTGMKGRGPRLGLIQRVKEEWAPFAAEFQDAPIHSLATGRLGYKWEDVEVENEKGEIVKEVAKAGTKMKAEGDFGHEPDLELEMAAVEDPDFIRYEKVRGRARRTFKSQMLHVATVKKSRVWALNGKAFSWKDQPVYKPGYCKIVAEAFKPHFDSIAIGGVHHVGEPGRPDSAELFETGNDRSYGEMLIRKQIAVEKWDATMALIAGGQTKDAIRWRQLIGEGISFTRSKTQFLATALPDLERHLDILLALERRLKTDSPVTDADLAECIRLAREDVDHPGKNLTLLEAMLTKSVAQAEKPNGGGEAPPQPF
jgi:hypothetical protein